MRIVVTGGAGFIGGNLVRRLERDGGDVVVLDDLSTGCRSNLEGTGAHLRVGSVADPSAVEAVVDGADAVVHLAALPSVQRSLADPLATHHANATGTLTVLEAVRRSGTHVVVASSSSVYGNTTVLPKHEELGVRPRSPYAVSKVATESYALAYQECFGTPVVAFRFFNVYGPLQAADHAYAAVIPKLVSTALDERTFRIEGDGHQTRDFTHVDSVCEAIGRVLRARATSAAPVNLAFGTRTSVLDLVAAVEQAVGHAVKVEHVAPRPGDVRDSQADVRKLEQLVPGVEPVPLATGLTSVVRWMRSRRAAVE